MNMRLFMKSLMVLLLLMVPAACGGAAAPAGDVAMPVVVDDTAVSAETAVDAYPAGEAPAPLAPAVDAYPAGDAPAPAAPAVDPYPAGDAAAAGMRTFVIVPEASSASYLVDEEFFEDALAKLGINAGLADVVGTTPDVAGQIQIDPATGALGQTVITANLGALSTDQAARDRWLRENGAGPQFGSAPPASFVATGVEGLPAQISEGQEVSFTLNGDLTVREVTQPVSFAVTAVLNGDTLTGSAETRLLMSSFGITPPDFARTLRVADEFGLRVELTAREG
jgi:polyisoprenoid-binding protein YceI